MLKGLFQNVVRTITNSICPPKKLRDPLSITTNMKRSLSVKTVFTKIDNDVKGSFRLHGEKVNRTIDELREYNGKSFEIRSIQRKIFKEYHMVFTIIQYNS